ncbi:hypothetical protein HHI36_020730 [Cryptolaemus montrouzieri]|uniref:Uncharacterized protein n=1 Tax=Cryptolaemus montrouzieri TaxID=559131 RepID=A0ABD2NBR9_9CUCU
MAPEREENYAENKNTIIINASKNELFKVHENWKILYRKLKIYWKVVINKDELSLQLLQNCGLLILPGSQTPFEENELNILNTYVNRGGRILILLSEHISNDNSNTHIFLEEYGIVPNMDALIRSHYYKYFHPKEVFLADSEINTCLKEDKEHLNIVYPFGCTMNVSKPSSIAFTSGSASFPVDRPLGAIFDNQNTGGRIIALGSGHLFADKYIDQENNDKFRENIFNCLLKSKEIALFFSEHDDIDVMEHNIVPNTAELANKPKLCLTDAISHTASIDYIKLLDHKIYSVNFNLVPDILRMYSDLNVKQEQLRIITPKFESPYPHLQAAVFPPAFRDLPLPPLELFDLDEAFSSVFSKLAQFTNKFIAKTVSSDEVTEDNLKFFITECARIVKVDEDDIDPKEILHEIGSEIAKFKSIDTIV